MILIILLNNLILNKQVTIDIIILPPLVPNSPVQIHVFLIQFLHQAVVQPFQLLHAHLVLLHDLLGLHQDLDHVLVDVDVLGCVLQQLLDVRVLVCQVDYFVLVFTLDYVLHLLALYVVVVCVQVHLAILLYLRWGLVPTLIWHFLLLTFDMLFGGCG